MERPMRLVVLGLSLSSSWGNGHATTFRALLKEFAARGHDILFLERDVPWYASNRDIAEPDYCQLEFYPDLAGLDRWKRDIAAADAVMVGVLCPEGVAVGRYVQQNAEGVTAFYDIDTPVTLAKLERGDFEYLSPEIIPGYDVYLSFTGGPDAPAARRQVQVAGCARALLLGRPGRLPAAGRPQEMGALLSRHLQPDRQPTFGTAADRAGAPHAGPPLRRCRAAISRRHPMAGQC
jgi:hypothetical protein